MLAFFLLFVLRQKDIAINILITSFFKLTITNFLKVAFYDTRPCFESERISLHHCSCEFGYPSGHSSEVFTMYFIIFYELLYKRDSVVAKVFSVLGFIFFTFMTVLGRIYYGAHFLDQTIAGCLVGFTCASSYVLMEQLDISNIVLNTNNRIQNLGQILDRNFEKIRKGFVFVLFTLGVLSVGFVIFLRYYLVYTFEDNPYHPYGKFCKKCFAQHYFFSDQSAKWVLINFLIPFMILLLYFRRENIYFENPRFYREWFSSARVFFLRAIIWIFIVAPLVIVMLFRFHNFIASIFFNLGLGMLFSLLFVFLQPVLLKLMKVGIQGDFMIVADNKYSQFDSTTQYDELYKEN